LSKKPESVVEKAVRGMLPKNRLGSELFRNLYVYAGENHPHEAQQPKVLDFNKIK
jgi:large subunit ribosomal protein L13